MPMTRAALRLLGLFVTALSVLFAAPVSATRGPVVATPAVPALVLAKNKAEKDSAAEAKLPSGCKSVAKPLGEVRVTRSVNCLKPRPILM